MSVVCRGNGLDLCGSTLTRPLANNIMQLASAKPNSIQLALEIFRITDAGHFTKVDRRIVDRHRRILVTLGETGIVHSFELGPALSLWSWLGNGDSGSTSHSQQGRVVRSNFLPLERRWEKGAFVSTPTRPLLLGYFPFFFASTQSPLLLFFLTFLFIFASILWYQTLVCAAQYWQTWSGVTAPRQRAAKRTKPSVLFSVKRPTK